MSEPTNSDIPPITKGEGTKRQPAPWAAVFHSLQDPRQMYSFTGKSSAPVPMMFEPRAEDALIEALPQIVEGDESGRAAEAVLPFELRGVSGAKADLIRTLPPGLTIITGGTASGKSTLTRGLTASPTFRRFLTVEPFDDAEEIGDPMMPSFTSVDRAMIAAVGLYYSSGKRVIPILDSLRAMLYEIGGSAGSKGVSTRFFTQLTRVSMDLARSGISLVATVNPTEDDSDFVANFNQKLSASVPMLVIVERTSWSSSATAVEGHIIRRPSRSPVAFTWSSRGPLAAAPTDVLIVPPTSSTWLDSGQQPLSQGELAALSPKTSA